MCIACKDTTNILKNNIFKRKCRKIMAQFNSQYQGNKCGKFDNDAYYTTPELARHCIGKVKRLIGDKATEYVEPSAGNGVFLDNLPDDVDKIGIDIDPKCEGIIQADFLSLPLDYKQGRVFIGNPPFGDRFNLGKQFFKKCCQCGDYVAFILPASQTNNSAYLYDFDLIYSENLGSPEFDGIDYYSGKPIKKNVACCFNIYARPENGELNKRDTQTLKDVVIVRNDSPSYSSVEDYDFRVCGHGGRSGKILDPDEPDLSTTWRIKVLKPEMVQLVYDAIKTLNINDYRATTSMRKCTKTMLVQRIKDCIPDIE